MNIFIDCLVIVGFHCSAEVKFDVVPLVYFYICFPMLLVLYLKKIVANTNVKELFHYVFF